ncbi:MAG: glycosyltransferase [Chloroflexi bacterium]|nr:glycosyltransferase [Chloroflexota bacterium]
MADGESREHTALIVTVLNEAGTIDALLESIASQSLPPDEVIVADGGSTDGTRAALHCWSSRLPLRVIEAEGANISRGRNVAIGATEADLIAVTDAGVRLDADWLERLRERMTPEIDVVSGFFRADPHSTFERALGATTLPARQDVNARRFLPSSRSVLFRRSAWQRGGGYPEWLDYCEDLVFDLALQRNGCRFAFAPNAIAWFRPRPSLGAFFRQYYRYARGDGKAGLWARRHVIRYATYACAGLLLARRGRWTWLLGLGGLAYTRRPYARLDLTGLSIAHLGLALGLIPLIRLTGDVAKMLGYPVGVCWRVRRTWTSRSSS